MLYRSTSTPVANCEYIIAVGKFRDALECNLEEPDQAFNIRKVWHVTWIRLNMYKSILYGIMLIKGYVWGLTRAEIWRYLEMWGNIKSMGCASFGEHVEILTVPLERKHSEIDVNFSYESEPGCLTTQISLWTQTAATKIKWKYCRKLKIAFLKSSPDQEISLMISSKMIWTCQIMHYFAIVHHHVTPLMG